MAVTASLLLSGNCGLIQGVANICAQLVGSLLAAGLLYGVVPDGGASSLGSNIGEGARGGQPAAAAALPARACLAVRGPAVQAPCLAAGLECGARASAGASAGLPLPARCPPGGSLARFTPSS